MLFAVMRLLIPDLLAVLATPTPVAATIPPVVWELVSFTESQRAPVTIAAPGRYTVQFLPAGELRLRLDCNQGRGGYSMESLVDGVPGMGRRWSKDVVTAKREP